MANETPLSYEIFLQLANNAGISSGDESDREHLEALYAFLQPVLDGLKSLEQIDVSQAEPPMSFTVPAA